MKDKKLIATAHCGFWPSFGRRSSHIHTILLWLEVADFTVLALYLCSFAMWEQGLSGWAGEEEILSLTAILTRILFFDILLTVHLNIILVMNQLNAQNLVL